MYPNASTEFNVTRGVGTFVYTPEFKCSIKPDSMKFDNQGAADLGDKYTAIP